MEAEMTDRSPVAPFPPERPADDARPVTQQIQEARAAEAALAGEHGTGGPPQYVDAPEPEGHNAGDYVEGGPRKGRAAKVAADHEKAPDQKAADKEDWRDKGSAASR